MYTNIGSSLKSILKTKYLQFDVPSPTGNMISTVSSDKIGEVGTKKNPTIIPPIN